MQPDNSDITSPTHTPSIVPMVGRLRLVAIDPVQTPQRRRAPRRRLVQAVSIDRRRADRRNAKPGIDGLLRTVLADDWT